VNGSKFGDGDDCTLVLGESGVGITHEGLVFKVKMLYARHTHVFREYSPTASLVNLTGMVYCLSDTIAQIYVSC